MYQGGTKFYQRKIVSNKMHANTYSNLQTRSRTSYIITSRFERLKKYFILQKVRIDIPKRPHSYIITYERKIPRQRRASEDLDIAFENTYRIFYMITQKTSRIQSGAIDDVQVPSDV
jgi:hypothetical protein